MDSAGQVFDWWQGDQGCCGAVWALYSVHPRGVRPPAAVDTAMDALSLLRELRNTGSPRAAADTHGGASSDALFASPAPGAAGELPFSARFAQQLQFAAGASYAATPAQATTSAATAVSRGGAGGGGGVNGVAPHTSPSKSTRPRWSPTARGAGRQDTTAGSAPSLATSAPYSSSTAGLANTTTASAAVPQSPTDTHSSFSSQFQRDELARMREELVQARTTCALQVRVWTRSCLYLGLPARLYPR